MIGGAMVTTIKTLWSRYKNKSKIAELTGHDWKTVSKMIKNIESGKETPIHKPHPKILDAYKEKIIEWIEAGLSGVQIYDELQKSGIKVGNSTARDYVYKIKKREKIFIRIHTKTGEEAQVDFGYVGLTLDNQGKKKRTWVFVMCLSYSRLSYCEKVYDQRVETFIQCHINAFNYFGGVAEYVKIDNLKAAILVANFYTPVYQQLYKTFADYYGFKPMPCRIKSPNEKGKVESGVKYVKYNFFRGRKFKDENDLNYQLRNWLDKTCNQRIHGTTRRIPVEMFLQEEKHKLIPLPVEEFKMPDVGSRKVYHDCHIYVDYNYYSVPFEYVGKEVDIEMSRNLLKISSQNQEIALHPRQEGKGKFCTNPAHYPPYKRFSGTEYQETYQIKMAGIGPYAEQVFFLLVKKCPVDWNRSVQGILSLQKIYPKEIVDLACKRAIAYGVCQYQTIKNICYNGSYNLPVEFTFEQELN